MKPRGFFILNGVHRAVASREAGRKTIPAVIYREGRKPEFRPRMQLDRLYSPKRSIDAVDVASIVPPIVVKIEIEPLGSRGQQSSVPLKDVVLE